MNRHPIAIPISPYEILPSSKHIETLDKNQLLEYDKEIKMAEMELRRRRSRIRKRLKELATQ